MKILGVDTGGTFTDFVFYDGQDIHVHKELSTPSAPEHAILNGITALEIDINNLHIIHGTTVATNALLEGKGARTAFITNHGFKDLLLIGRQTRQELYNLTPKKVRTIFNTDLFFEIGGRINAKGQILIEYKNEELEVIVKKLNQLGVEAVAVCFLFSFIDDQYEKQVNDQLSDKYFVSISSEVLAEYKEYERGVATWLNSYLGPVLHSYLSSLDKKLSHSEISVMQSHGLTLNASSAQNNAVRLLLSGPAGGLWGSLQTGKSIDQTQLLTFDMGGTSTDVSIINNEFKLTRNSEIAGLPISVPMLDIHTIGAGGGSIAWVDEGGLLQVGPESAGAKPGPACYGQGGKNATVTDAHVVLGRIPANCKLAGKILLDYHAAVSVIEKIARILQLDVQSCARGIVRIANEQMAQALRVMSVHRGYDPKNFTLVSFGGAGGLHVCDLVESLNMRYALVPGKAGVLSAYGLLVAPPGKEISKTHIKLLQNCEEAELEKLFLQLEKKILTVLPDNETQGFSLKHEVDLRYYGQSATLRVNFDDNINLIDKFHQKHKKRYGYALKIPVELVNLHLTASGGIRILPPIKTFFNENEGEAVLVRCAELDQKIPVYKRDEISLNQVLIGPAIIAEKETTIYVAPHWQVFPQQSGALLLERIG